MTVTNLPVIAGMSPMPLPGFERERWTTCYVERLDVGDVFSVIAEPFRPAVLLEADVEAIPGEAHGWFSGVGRYVDTGELTCFKVRGNVSAVVRCDMQYRVQR
ncbi:hypothetical protein [Streptomyces noursei]|uniref:hypothetical protein n=1 Tax=Streptomyces noursei TaxID=1971 RepID=UPI0016793B35|nr:hypothetical protein [Streptomyces noursei]MCZ1014009.1 hypothetical protein [Streptomyces noursei]GGX49160.1 hypothetical protein GCM10010341_83500 [Streptomyces noursei]